MDQKTLKELKDYLRVKNSAGGCMLAGAGILAVGFGAAAVACLVDLIANGNDGMVFPAVGSGALTLFFGAMLFMSLVWPRIQANRQIQDRANMGALEELLLDFGKAVRPYGARGFVLLGERWIYGRACGQPVAYGRISKLQIRSIRSGGAALETTLFATLVTGKSVCVCREIGCAEAGPDIRAAVEAIRDRNPRVQGP